MAYLMFHKHLPRYILILVFVISTLTVYTLFFKHPPPDQILERNKKAGESFNLRALVNKRRLRSDSLKTNNDALKLKYNSGKQSKKVVSQPLNSNEKYAKEKHHSKKTKNRSKNYWSVNGDVDKQNDEPWLKMGDGLKETVEEKSLVQKRTGKLIEKHNDRLIADADLNNQNFMKGGSSQENIQSDLNVKESIDLGDKPELSLQGIKNEEKWKKFIEENHYTVIGTVLDSCDNPREQLGTVIMLEDLELGGVKTRTYYNFTLGHEMGEGSTFKFEVKYNSQDLYDNYWDICEMEANLEVQNRTFVCPLRKGPHNFVKEKHVPFYLPKGRYQSKAWVTDEKEQLVVCGYSDFVL